ncbi:isopentenyl-diphosphate Delta-isomerase 1-like [Ruditapes philippinarum]|uniref:isopentenyl-diphosphate Delta-isomerase 1-like n=1 Tax=Ruditapes philippinarum TaxID=129788 RepID=UPI00295A946A|nr:isopentenyl-diphosphate Delta-isomerase 1-like [Ruditapes philippinarum]
MLLQKLCFKYPALRFSHKVEKTLSRLFSVSYTSSMEDTLLKDYDDQQVQLMKEPCILVNDHDEVIGTASKKSCHLLSNINNGMLHRAFSVFLFSSKNELLLQQRSDAKITFPGLFTNTCCSHPLNVDLEMEEKNAMGVKRAAQRKLFHELGITPEQIPLDTFKYLTRIRYKAVNIPDDKKFGENEIDYVLIICKDVDLSINTNEVKSIQYVTKEELKELIKSCEMGNVVLTPWFKLICEHFLFQWWDNLDNLKKLEDHKNIHDFTDKV